MLLTIKRLFETLRTSYGSMREPEPLRDKILFYYSQWCLNQLQAILDAFDLTEAPSKELIEELSRFLDLNWSIVNSSIVSPTAIPRADITKILCAIAQCVADEKNKLSSEHHVAAIQLLMPTITTESIRISMQIHLYNIL